MMLEIAILGGPRVKANRPFQLINVTVVILLLGFGATVAQDIFLKVALFGCGACGFLMLAYLFDRVVYEHTGGETRLFSSAGDSSGKTPPLKRLLIKVLATWVGFPVWWTMSPDGFSVVEDRDVHQGVFSILNIVSKVVFVWYIFALDYDMHPDLFKQESPSTKDTEDAELGHRPNARQNESNGSDEQRLVSTDKGKLDTALQAVKLDRLQELQALKKPQVHLAPELTDYVRTVSDSASIPEEEVQRVLDLLGRAWVVSEDVLSQLSLEDLRRLDIPVGLAAGLKALQDRRQKDRSNPPDPPKLTFAADISQMHAAEHATASTEDRASSDFLPLYQCCATNTEPNGEIVALHQRPIHEDMTLSNFDGGRH